MRVRFDKVSKSFGAALAVREVDLEVGSGECMVLLGPSGCGKTTLLRLLAGLERADSGHISIGDRVVDDVPPAERDVAMVFQNYALYPHFTVAENIGFPLRVRKTPRAELDTRVREAAARLGLEKVLDRRPAQLSGGQQQRVALARAIVRRPSVYLMDEPLSNLDAQLRVQTRGELKRLRQELGTTTVYVTHDQGEAMTLGDRVALLRQGTIEQIGTPLELYRQPRSRAVAAFLGSPAINLWPGEVEGDTVTVAGVRLRAGQAARGHGRVEVGVRPEDISVSSSPGEGRAAGRVLVLEPMGNETIVTLESGGQRVVARAAAELATSETLWFSLNPDRVLLFDPETGLRLASGTTRP
jgi:ABC-type sugar transport system ATPase subunit